MCHLYTVYLYYVAAYHVGKISPLRESKAPAYTFGLKLGSSKVSAGNPSPNKYQLPSLVGSNVISKKSPPAYSMTGRSRIGSFHEDLSKVGLLNNGQVGTNIIEFILCVCGEYLRGFN